MSAIAIATLLGAAVWLPIAVWFFGIRRAPVYHPLAFILGYHLIGFILRPAGIWAQNHSDTWVRTGLTPDSSTILYTAVLACIALLAMVLGVSIATPRGRVFRRIRPIKLSIERRHVYYIVVATLLALGVYSMLAGYGGAGLESVQAFEVEYDSKGGQRLVGISGYVLALSEFVPVICVILYLDARTRRVAIALLLLYVAIRFYIGAQRLSFVVAVIGVYLASLVNSGRRYPRIRIILVGLVFLLIFDLIGGDRFAFRRLSAGEVSVAALVENYSSSRAALPLINDMAEFDVASSALTVVPDKSGWTYGTQYLRLFTWPIPRQLWPDKPVYTSVVDLNQYGFFLALTHTLYVDAYMVFGLIPMTLILGGWGYYLGRLYERARRTTSFLWFMLFWVHLMYMKTLLRDGGVTVLYFVLISMAGICALTFSGKVRMIRA